MSADNALRLGTEVVRRAQSVDKSTPGPSDLVSFCGLTFWQLSLSNRGFCRRFLIFRMEQRSDFHRDAVLHV